MQSRHAARELALILFSQFDIVQHNEKNNFQKTIVDSLRILTNSSMEDLKSVTQDILELKSFIAKYEANHPKNLQRPIEANDRPVELPMTDDMQSKLDKLLDISEKIMLSLEIAEMAVLEENSEVKSYIKHITREFHNHQAEIDGQIQKFASGWDISRLVNMDKSILRIAICELLFVKKAPLKVIIDEAVELAKKYSTNDSASFVNGILAKVAMYNNLN